MYDPPHPREAVLGLCLEPFDLSVADAAAHLEVDTGYLADLCAGQQRITADLAIRLEQAFGGTADNWMRVQAACDLAQTRLKSEHIQSNPSAPRLEPLARNAYRLRSRAGPQDGLRNQANRTRCPIGPLHDPPLD